MNQGVYPSWTKAQDTYAADVQLNLHMDLPTTLEELSLKLLPVCGISSPDLASRSGHSGRGCAKVGACARGPYPLRGEKEGWMDRIYEGGCEVQTEIRLIINKNILGKIKDKKKINENQNL